MYSPQPGSQPSPEGSSYNQPNPYQQPGNPYQPANPYQQPAQPYTPNPYQQPQPNPYQQQQQVPYGVPNTAYGQPGAYPPQNPGMAPNFNVTVGNRLSTRAMWSGIISIVLSLITLFQLVGFTGAITGTFAIINGFRGLYASRQLGGAGRGRAITGIVLGFVAWGILLLAIVVRARVNSVAGN